MEEHYDHFCKRLGVIPFSFVPQCLTIDMKIKDQNEKFEVTFASAKISELIDELNSIKDQDYFDIEELKRIQDRMRDDIANYIKATKEEIKQYLGVGRIIKIVTSDGISGTNSKYYKFTKIDLEKRGQITYDLLQVFDGEFERRVEHKINETEYVDILLDDFRYSYDSLKEGEDVNKEWEYYLSLINWNEQ